MISFRYATAVTNLDMTFAQAPWLRVVQMSPRPFCFISIPNAGPGASPRH
jgi:hypothetical protein